MLRKASVDVGRLKPVAIGLGLAALSLAGCIVEEGDKACGKDQVKVDVNGALYCECAPGFIIDPMDGHKCLACGEHEEVAMGKCVCEAGYTRPSEGASCMMSALGAACTDNSGCSGDFPTCVDGYCTENCSASTDCEAGWFCDVKGAVKACKKPPTGFGMTCAGSSDCAGKDAAFCEMFQSKTCQVQCSKEKPCPGDWGCCDFGIMTICLETSRLMSGMCPAPGMLVTP
jgi:hypothetical protein